jgi:hypothetical protein
MSQVTNQKPLLSTPRSITNYFPQSGPLFYPAVRATPERQEYITATPSRLSFCHTTSGPPPMQMTTYELFLCWIIVMLLVIVVGEANIINLG